MEERKATGWAGWVAFASLLLMFEGIMQVIYGLAALFHQTWYVATSTTIYSFDVTTWGWASLVIGAILFITGILLLRGSMVGRTLGMIFVVLGALESLAFIGVAPVWSLLALVLYVVVSYAIIAHGSEMKSLSTS